MTEDLTVPVDAKAPWLTTEQLLGALDGDCRSSGSVEALGRVDPQRNVTRAISFARSSTSSVGPSGSVSLHFFS
jgi:hypothetical protein